MRNPKGKNWLSTGLPKTEDHTASGLKTKYREGKLVKHPDAVITGDRLHFALVAMRAMPLKTALDKGMIKIEGNTDKFRELLGCMDKFHGNFHAITP